MESVHTEVQSEQGSLFCFIHRARLEINGKKHMKGGTIALTRGFDLSLLRDFSA